MKASEIPAGELTGGKKKAQVTENINRKMNKSNRALTSPRHNEGRWDSDR